jgi:NPCBM/NEW2 domain
VCWLLGLIAIWLPHFPAGVDLPQHATIFRMWADLSNGPYELREIYHKNLFTPYLLPYAIALQFTRLFGALAATKCLLTFAVLATPLYLTRWLRAVGAAPAFGLLGFVVTFDYCYLWGFVSCTLAIPLMFAYLAEFENQGDTPTWRKVAKTTLLAGALFFSHGITFGISLVIAGSSWLLRGRWLARIRPALHALPLAALAALWLAASHKEASADAIQQWFDARRAVHLFSGAFTTFPDDNWAKVGAAGVAIFLVVTRPKLSSAPRRWLPLCLATLVFVALPDVIASTWFVATRFCVFIHALAPAVLVPREGDRIARQWPWVLFALVASFLVLLNVRLHDFNRELDGFREIAQLIPPGEDLQTLVPETESTDPIFGPAEFGQIPAWVSAQQSGLIANDMAIMPYYQIPIRRSDVPGLQHYPYAISHGSYARNRGTLRRLTMTSQGPGQLIKESGGWVLMKRPDLETKDFTVVRYGQGWGELQIDHNVEGGRLAIAHEAYDHGFGTHARAIMRIRLKRAARILVGACGLDDSAETRGRAAFRVRDSQGTVLFESGPMRGGAHAEPFGVNVEGQKELLLEVDAVGAIDYAHADWVNLSLQ